MVDTLQSAKKSIEISNSQNNTLISIDNTMSDVLSQITKLNLQFDRFITDLQIMLLQQKDNDIPTVQGQGEKPTMGSGGGGGSLLGGLIASLPTLIAGITGALVGAISAQIKSAGYFAKAISQIFKVMTPKIVTGFLSNIGESITKLFANLKKTLLNNDKLKKVISLVDDIAVRIFVVFDDLRKSVTAGFSNIKFDIGKSGFVKTITNFTEGLKNFGKLILSPFVVGLKTIGEIFAPITRFFANTGKGGIGAIKEGISKVASVFSRMGSVFGALASTVGKLFLPVTIVMTLIDTVKSTMAGFEEEGFIGGVKGAIKGLINSLIMMPLDLLKDLISWALGKLGFEEASKTLDSFSFQDMFSDFVDMLFDLPSRMMAALLPDPTGTAGMLLSSTDTGKSLYDFAKVDTATGERIVSPPATPARELSGESLSEESRTAAAQNIMGQQTSVNVVDNSVKSTNNSSSSAAIMMESPAATNPYDLRNVRNGVAFG